MIDLRRVGRLERPDGEGLAGGGTCDDRVRVTLGLADGVVVAARIGVDGCATALRAAAWVADRVEHGTLLDAARLGVPDVLSGARLEDGGRCAAVAVDALHAAVGDAFVRGASVAPAGGTPVAVAMSGGVDSAVALAEAAARGPAVGVTLRLWIDPAAPNGDRACCAPSAVRSARETCHERGVPHVALDLRDAFRGAVVDPFVASYARGATPNPCVRCNGVFRFDALARFADAVGARELHTGHYARIARLDGVPLVARGVDARKDQSYMLATVEPALLERLRFPLGDRTKDESRARARELGLAAAEARESQEVCFLGGGDYRTFLSRQGVAGTPGAIVDEAGATLGRHAGVEGFTPGQRRGLGIAAPEPLYVVRTEPERGAVVVGPRRSLGRRRVLLDDARLYVRRERVEAKLRYRSPGVPARVAPSAGGRLRLDLEREVFAVAHGQTAALYEGDVVVGAGVVAADGVAA